MATIPTSPVTQPHAPRLLLLSVVLAGALVAWSMWWAEIRWIKGWNSLAWLSGYNWSAIPICLCIAAVCSALERSIPLRRRLYFVGVASLLMWVAFDIGRAALFELGNSWAPRAGLLDTWLATLLLADVGVAFALFFCANKLLVPLHAWTSVLLFVALSAVAPLSAATIQLIPALRGQTDAVHAVKMGYPVFWTALLVPLCLRIGRR